MLIDLFPWLNVLDPYRDLSIPGVGFSVAIALSAQHLASTDHMAEHKRA